MMSNNSNTQGSMMQVRLIIMGQLFYLMGSFKFHNHDFYRFLFVVAEIFSWLIISSLIICPQTTGSQLIGRSVPSPSGVPGTNTFENTTTSPLSYANSPRSGTSMMNTPSPLQHAQQQQQRQKMVQLPQHQQPLLSQQQLRQVSASAGLSQVFFNQHKQSIFKYNSFLRNIVF